MIFKFFFIAGPLLCKKFVSHTDYFLLKEFIRKSAVLLAPVAGILPLEGDEQEVRGLVGYEVEMEPEEQVLLPGPLQHAGD